MIQQKPIFIALFLGQIFTFTVFADRTNCSNVYQTLRFSLYEVIDNGTSKIGKS
jgi:hypothetical protein